VSYKLGKESKSNINPALNAFWYQGCEEKSSQSNQKFGNNPT